MHTFKYKVICDTLYKYYMPSTKSKKSWFLNAGEQFNSKYLPFKHNDNNYWLKFNREKDNKIVNAQLKNENGDYKIKLIIDYSENNISSENKINLLNIQLKDSINIYDIKKELNTSNTNPFHLNELKASNNSIQLFLQKKNYIEINLLLNPNDNLLNNEINELKEIISNYFLKYKQNYCLLTKKRKHNRGRLSKSKEKEFEVRHSKFEFDNIKDKIKTFCLNYILNKLNEELSIQNNKLNNKFEKKKLFKIKQNGKRKVSNNYYNEFIKETFKEIFRRKVIFQCNEENNNIILIDEIYERKNEFKEIIDFLDMKYIDFFEIIKTYLKSEDVPEIKNKEKWEELKEKLEKNDDNSKINNPRMLDNNKIVISLKKDFRESINNYIEKEYENEEYEKYKEVFILSFEDFFKILEPKQNKHLDCKKKEKSKSLPTFKIKKVLD